jgi:GMP reductase
MLGGMLAGHDEGGGEIITRHYKTGEVVQTDQGWEDLIEERKFLKEYRSSEGREIQVPYRGEIENTIQDLLGGVRSTCTYAGAKKLKWLSKCTTFVKTGEQFNSVFADK